MEGGRANAGHSKDSSSDASTRAAKGAQPNPFEAQPAPGAQGPVDSRPTFGNRPDGRVSPGEVQRYQQLWGNQAVARVIERMQTVRGPGMLGNIDMVARQTPAPAPAVAPAAAPPAAAAVPKDLEDFRAKGPMPSGAAGTTIQPPGGFGAFQARYDPKGMDLTITMNVGITFVDGLTLAGGRAVPGDPSLANAANLVNRLPKVKREAEVAKWKWSGDQETWMSGYRSNVTGAWASAGTGLSFQSSKKDWESQLANVKIVVNTQNVTVAGPLPAGASSIPATAGPIHCQATIYKTPEDNSDFGAAVGGRDASGTTTLAMGSGQTVAHGHLLRQQVRFGVGESTLNAAAKGHLDNIIFSFQSPAGGAGTSIDITGHADTSGGGTPEGDQRNKDISEKRATAVGDYIKGKLAGAATRIKTTTGVGAAGGEAGAEGRRVDIMFAGGAGQNTAAHEFGHMLGLDDQYAVDPTGAKGVVAGTGGAVGTANADDARVKAMGMGQSVYENNDNMMSLGSTVKAPHYVTFMEALRSVTSLNDWKMK